MSRHGAWWLRSFTLRRPMSEQMPPREGGSSVAWLEARVVRGVEEPIVDNGWVNWSGLATLIAEVDELPRRLIGSLLGTIPFLEKPDL